MLHTLSCENTTEDIQLSAVRVRGMSVCNCIARMHMDLEARGSPDALDVMHHFFNYFWLNDLDLPYLAELLDLRNPQGRAVSLREDGWAQMEPDQRQVRICNTYGDSPCALIAWEEFSAAMQLKHRFLGLMRRYEGHGIPRYSVAEGFRVRLHAPGLGGARAQGR
ncbi:hypothetical protein [Delftia acidovorans]|uniref:hypothetical protein n=1 Tax=Delftia acidovorans TaxID=80866 RepID=UPI003016E5C1